MFVKMGQAKVETMALGPCCSCARTWESGVSVCPQFSRVTARRIFPKLGQRLRGDEWGTMTRAVFSVKTHAH